MANLRSIPKKPRSRSQITDPELKQNKVANQAQPFDCKCGDSQCQKEWHSLGVWLVQDPPGNYDRLLAQIEDQLRGNGGNK